MILAAGRGTRLKSVTGDLPKPLLPLHGRPLLDYVLANLRRAGFDRFLLVVGYRHELFYGRYAGDTSVHYALQDPVDGTGSAALLARGFTANEPFLLIFGDILASPDDILALWQRLKNDPAASGVLAVQHVDDPFQGAAVYEDAGVLTRIVEKPPLGASQTNWNSAGIYAFRPEIFDELARLEMSPRGEYELTDVLVKWLAQGRRILVHPLQGEWRDVGRPEDVEAAARLISSSLS
ncbi:MAG: nucleotidyltransferase family protein [Candidatus Solibacter usitatus]|nr:nucleotidyltransferase family protein [Candidatus Solibacter usitatus]